MTAMERFFHRSVSPIDIMSIEWVNQSVFFGAILTQDRVFKSNFVENKKTDLAFIFRIDE